MSAITINEDIVHYEKLGRGRPVILIHGWIGSWRYWIPLMRQLQLKYAVYAIDLFGFGDSAKAPQRYTIDQQVHMLDIFMDELNIPKAALVGHGLGAQIVLRFAQQQQINGKGKVARILLTGAPLFDPGNLDDRIPPNTLKPLPPPDPKNPYAGYEIIPELQHFEHGEADNDESHSAQTLTRRPAGLDIALGKSKVGADLTVSNANNETIQNPAKLIDRDALRKAALERGNAVMAGSEKLAENPVAAIEKERVSTGNNALRNVLSVGSTGILAKCFKRAEPEYEKLEVVVAQMDEAVLTRSSYDFDAGETLDTLRQIQAPAVIVHGEDDPIITVPNEEVWNYITAEHGDTTLPIPLPGVRHFPMLEHEPFIRLIGSFLETPDISKLEVQNRWRRRSR